MCLGPILNGLYKVEAELDSILLDYIRGIRLFDVAKWYMKTKRKHIENATILGLGNIREWDVSFWFSYCEPCRSSSRAN